MVLPVDVKAAALRYRNTRPYAVAGVMPAFDVSKRRRDYISLNNTDFYLSVGFGCDFYLPYFKFIPEVKFCFGMSKRAFHTLALSFATIHFFETQITSAEIHSGRETQREIIVEPHGHQAVNTESRLIARLLYTPLLAVFSHIAIHKS